MSDRYQIVKKIGQGGVGAVYLAEDTSLNRRVAIKKLKEATEDDFEEDTASASHGTPESLLHEAITLSALQHPNIVTVFDVVDQGEGPFVVMEYLSGETLERTIKRAPLPLDDFFTIGLESLEALSAAHRQGILHRDIKPSNLMLVWDDKGTYRTKILDFGLAKLTSGPALQSMDQSGSILGTIHFMAPEQFERDLLDQRTDLYSLGCVLFRALSQKYPFDGQSAPEVMASHLQHHCYPIRSLRPDVPVEVASWLDRLIARQPDDRIRGSEEALEELKELRARYEEGTLTLTPQKQPGSETSSHPDLTIPQTEQSSPSPSETASVITQGANTDEVLLPTVRLKPPNPPQKAPGKTIPWILTGAVATAAVLGFVGWNQISGASNEKTEPAVDFSSTKEALAETITPSRTKETNAPVFSPFEVDEIVEHLGQKVIFEGTVKHAAESRSGKTRYLNFSWPPGESVPLAMSVTALNDAEFSLSKLERLVGSKLRAKGEIETVFGKPQLKILQWSDLEEIP